MLCACHRAGHEGHAAASLESIADCNVRRSYAIDLSTDREPWRLECAPIVRAIVDDIRNGRSAPEISSAFHNTLAEAIATVVGRIREKTSIRRVALTGGVFQNTLLLERTFDALVRDRFELLLSKSVPCNDGGLSLGQAWIASRSVVCA